MQHISRVPVLILAFNRPQLVKELLNSLPLHEISHIYVSIDGPRNEDDYQKAEQILSILEEFSQKIRILVRHSLRNQGCRLGVISGLDWFFKQEVEGGLVLEDDCFPNQEFFGFLKDMRSQDVFCDIGMISAHNPLEKVDLLSFESRFVFINGWYMRSSTWKKIRSNLFALAFPSRSNHSQHHQSLSERIFWWAAYARARIGPHDTWDSLFYRAFSKEGLKCLVPGTNMVKNLGYGKDATHTTDPNGSIVLVNGSKLSAGVRSPRELDDIIAREYFGIKKRHAITPLLRVLVDLLTEGNVPNFENELGSNTTREFSFPLRY